MFDYRHDYYATAKPDFIAHALEDEAWSNLAWNDRLEIFERILPAHRRKILDIGCGPGLFLKAAKARGWRGFGFEPSIQAATAAQEWGADVQVEYFDPSYVQERFDVVHLNNVLEHVEFPRETIRGALSLLDPGGLICVGVPNDNSPLQKAAVHALNIPEWWISPHHLNYYDFDSISRLLESEGCTIQERTTSFPMEMFLLMGIDYVTEPSMGRKCHELRRKFDMALDNQTRRTIYRALAQAGIGREAVIIAKGPNQATISPPDHNGGWEPPLG